ncbi:CU044_5270 family protein [Micromonospora sp. NPDC047557]|uniref:CU044_5270 family protein n=1 Tax=Micromonospora sp. NPDC047557 TaxID=3364250 RepID=UPI00371BE030
MVGAERTRTLLSPADPARNTVVAPPPVSARDLIERAGATDPAPGHRRVRPTRRLLLTAGTLAVAAGAVAVLQPFDEQTPDDPGGSGGAVGTLLVPVAYQFDADPPAADPPLRTLASEIKDTEYDHRTGRYMYHQTRVWGEPVLSSPDGRHHMAFAGESKVWQAADGTGSQSNKQLEPQYPDQESRVYWQRRFPSRSTVTSSPAPSLIPLPPMELTPPSADPSQLRELLNVNSGAGAASKGVSTLYARYVVPRAIRAEILRVIADVPGFRWRGRVADRAGRAGVAVTVDDRENHQQSLLIFDPTTGELLAYELLTLAPVRISAYQLILETTWTDRIG